MTDLILPRQNEKFAGFSENTLQYRSAASLRSYPHRRKGGHQKGVLSCALESVRLRQPQHRRSRREASL